MLLLLFFLRILVTYRVLFLDFSIVFPDTDNSYYYFVVLPCQNSRFLRENAFYDCPEREVVPTGLVVDGETAFFIKFKREENV